MIVIGMTGPIGHGKSTFAAALKELEPRSTHLESSLIIAEVANDMHAVLPKNAPSSFRVWHERTTANIPDPYNLDELNSWLSKLPEILRARVGQTADFERIKLDPLAIEEHPIEYQKLIMHVEALKREPRLASQPITKENKEKYRPFLQWLGGYLAQKVSKSIWYDEIVRRVQAAESQGCELCIIGGMRFPSDATTLRQVDNVVICKVYRPGHLQNDMLDPTERERDNIPVDCTIASNSTVDDLKVTAAQILKDIQSNNLQPNYQASRAKSA